MLTKRVTLAETALEKSILISEKIKKSKSCAEYSSFLAANIYERRTNYNLSETRTLLQVR